MTDRQSTGPEKSPVPKSHAHAYGLLAETVQGFLDGTFSRDDLARELAGIERAVKAFEDGA